jgi:hypothetical protein
MASRPPLPTPRRKKNLWLIAGVAIVIAGTFGYIRLKPELEQVRSLRAGKSSKAAVRDNLVRIGAAADDYFAKNPLKNAVVVKDLVRAAPSPLGIEPVLGESYDDLVISRGWSLLKVALPDGSEITVPRH